MMNLKNCNAPSFNTTIIIPPPPAAAPAAAPARRCTPYSSSCFARGRLSSASLSPSLVLLGGLYILYNLEQIKLR